jgi:uncharacterized membrane protein
MSKNAVTSERAVAFSDGVFAIIITILVLDLRPPESASVAGLLSLWPRALSYAVSYLFLAIVWLNHHYLMRYAELATPRLLWGNFAHLFTVSLVPFTTAWIAATSLAAIPVAVYAAIFLLVNATYMVLCWEGVDRPGAIEPSPRIRRKMRWRSIGTLVVFAAASVLALEFPLVGMALVCACLIVYLRPQAPGEES